MSAASRQVGGNRRRGRTKWLIAAVALVGVLVIFTIRYLSPSENPDLLWDQAQTALQADRIDDAERLLGRIEAAREPIDKDLLLQSQVAMARHADDEALASLNRIPDSSPIAAQARRLAGQIELRRKRVRLAESYLLAALKLDPEEVQARRELVFIYGMQLRRDELGEVFHEMGRRVFLTFDDAFLWSLTRSSVWDANEQSESLRAFIEADPEDRWSRLALVDSLITLGNLDEAETIVSPLPDDDPEARARRAELAIARGDLTRAEILLAQGGEEHAETLRLRGLLALRRRQADEAIRYYLAAEKLDPEDRDTLFGLARAYSLAGDEVKAKPYIDAAARLDELATLIQYASTPEGRRDPELPRKLARACEAARRLDEAEAWYKIATALRPTDREAQQALFRLTQARVTKPAATGSEPRE